MELDSKIVGSILPILIGIQTPYNNAVMEGLENVNTAANEHRTGCVVAVFALVFLTCSGSVSYADGSQDFESWPTTVAWGTTMHAGWTLSDGQVKPSRGLAIT